MFCSEKSSISLCIGTALIFIHISHDGVTWNHCTLTVKLTFSLFRGFSWFFLHYLKYFFKYHHAIITSKAGCSTDALNFLVMFTTDIRRTSSYTTKRDTESLYLFKLAEWLIRLAIWKHIWYKLREKIAWKSPQCIFFHYFLKVPIKMSRPFQIASIVWTWNHPFCSFLVLYQPEIVWLTRDLPFSIYLRNNMALFESMAWAPILSPAPVTLTITLHCKSSSIGWEKATSVWI